MKTKKIVVNLYHIITRSNTSTYSHLPSCFSLYLLKERITPEHILDASKQISVALIWNYFYFSEKFGKCLKYLKSDPEWDIGSWIFAYYHYVKSVRIRSYSGPHFSRIFPHSDWIQIRRYTEYLCIQPECGKKCWTKNDKKCYTSS